MKDLECVLWPQGESAPAAGSRVLLSSGESHHAVRVRRLLKGDEVWAITGGGNAARCIIVEPDPESTLLEVAEVLHEWREPSRHVTLYQALIRPVHMELIIEQGTGLGMRALVPVMTERVERKDMRIERLERLAAESAKQCGRGWIPDISEVHSWEEFLSAATGTHMLVADADASMSLYELLHDDALLEVSELGIVIGPEGGFSTSELEQLCSIGAKKVHLGARRMRSETAAAFALSLLMLESK